MSDCPFTLVPHIKINPSYFVLYNHCQWHDLSKRRKRDRLPPPVDKSHHGIISDRAAAKIRKAIDWLLYIANDKQTISAVTGKSFNFKLSFITLTLSSEQLHSDSEIKSQLLNQFLVEARKKWNIVHYLWRAEPQINGNIHFHILCDKFCPWSEVRDTWNRIQNKLGYVDNYRKQQKAFFRGGFRVREDLLKKWAYKNQVRAYRTGSKQDWNSPNSTDIHSIKNIKNLPAYLSKYCTKNRQGREIEGNLWNLSESLSSIDSPSEVIYNEIMDEVKLIFDQFGSDVYHAQYYSIAYIPVSLWSSVVQGNLLKLFQDYVNGLKNSS